jgi:hypothetical protein
VTDGKKIEGFFSTGQSPQWAVVPVEEEEEEEEEEEDYYNILLNLKKYFYILVHVDFFFVKFIPRI